jgi:ABC-type polysaccharide/polyol phosphate export permease
MSEEKSLLEINRKRGFLLGPWLMWQNIQKHHYLVSNFITRDLRLKYRNSMLGYFWSLLEPLLLVGVYFTLFSILSNNPEQRYGLWVFIGVITYGYFAKSLSGAIASLTNNEAMIKQAYFPREIFALTNLGSNLCMTGLSLLVTIPFMYYFEIYPTVYLLMVPLGLIMTSLLALGIGLGMACLNVINRDIEHFFRFIIRAGFYLSPVIWTIDMVPKSRAALSTFMFLNPITVPITMVRNGIDGRELGIDLIYVTYSVAFCILSFLLGTMVFKRFEADVVKKI